MKHTQPIISIHGLWPDMEKYLSEKLSGITYTPYPEGIALEKLNPATELLIVFVESKIDAKVFSKLPKLKAIATMSTGFDHINLKIAKRKGIKVVNVPTYGDNTVAEHAMSLILGLSRKLFSSVERVKQGVYDFHGLRGTDLRGKTLGVIGTGSIGKQLIHMAQGFSLNIIAYDLFPNKTVAKKLNFKYVSLRTLLEESDIVSLHAPLTKKTYHLLNKKNIALLKKGAYIINTARGALIDPSALLGALQNNHIAGAGLDVLEDENLIQNYEEVIRGKCTVCELKTSLINKLIIQHPNTIVTPHNAFNSTEAIQRIVDTTAQNIRALLKNKPINLVQ